MAATFDGVNLRITLDAPTGGVLNQTVEQIYDDAKQWHLHFSNRKYPFPFGTSGGEQITTNTIAGQYYFLLNDEGWRIQTTDEDQDVFVDGNLIPNDLTQRVTIGRPGRTVAYFGLQPLVTGLTGLSAQIATDVMAYIIETGYTFEQVMRILAAHAAGNINQDGAGVYQIRDLNNTVDRIEGDDAANGGRTITTVTPG